MQIFKGLFPVCYGQFYFLDGSEWDGDLYQCFSNQSNGLCGVARGGVVFFITGLHTGKITLDVRFHESEPQIDSSYDEIVEASFSVTSNGFRLEAWGGELNEDLCLPQGNYRIRYSAKNFGLAEDQGKYDEGDIEFYLIDIWKSGIGKDKIIKTTAEMAEYWHNELGK